MMCRGDLRWVVVTYVGSCVVAWGVYLSWRVVYETLWVLRWCWVTIHVDGRCEVCTGCDGSWWVVVWM